MDAPEYDLMNMMRPCNVSQPGANFQLFFIDFEFESWFTVIASYRGVAFQIFKNIFPAGDRNNVVSLLFVKDLALLDPDDNFTIQTVRRELLLFYFVLYQPVIALYRSSGLVGLVVRELTGWLDSQKKKLIFDSSEGKFEAFDIV